MKILDVLDFGKEKNQNYSSYIFPTIEKTMIFLNVRSRNAKSVAPKKKLRKNLLKEIMFLISENYWYP
jgi:hypothetical protein